MREIKIGQTIKGTFGFDYTIVKVGPDAKGRDWVVMKDPEGKLSHRLREHFEKLYGDQLPKEKPKQGELM